MEIVFAEKRAPRRRGIIVSDHYQVGRAQS
jgi:hypothetical protein